MATNNYNYATLSSSPPYYIYATYNSFIGNNILVSANFGLSFSSITLASSQFYFLSIVSSSNGQNLAAAAYVYLNSVTFEGICSSFNYGKNWTLINASLSVSSWESLAISATGQYIVAGQFNRTRKAGISWLHYSFQYIGFDGNSTTNNISTVNW